MIYKSALIVGILFAGNLAVEFIRDGYEMGSVVAPSYSLDEVPLNLDDWKGTDLPADPRIREVLRAKEGIDRVYRNQQGKEVLVHAVWTDDYLRLHFPQQCYRESGWELIKTQDVEIERHGGQAFPAKLLNFAQGEREIQVLYWFQLGGHVFLDRVEHRLLRRKVCWGQKEWPPLMKFMLETDNTGLGRSQEALVEFASLLSRDIPDDYASGT